MAGMLGTLGVPVTLVGMLTVMLEGMPVLAMRPSKRRGPRSFLRSTAGMLMGMLRKASIHGMPGIWRLPQLARPGILSLATCMPSRLAIIPATLPSMSNPSVQFGGASPVVPTTVEMSAYRDVTEGRRCCGQRGWRD